MNQKFELSDWVIDPKQCLLLHGAENIKLEPKAMALLVVLAKSEGELVSRKDIFQMVWPKQHVTDYALNTLIASLRKSLDRISNGSVLVETRPKLGYRLTKRVIWLDGEISNEQAKPIAKATGQLKRLEKLIKYKCAIVRGAVIASIIVVIWGLGFNSKLGKNDLQQTSNISIESKQESVIRYLVKVTLAYSDSLRHENGDLMCSDVTYETISKAVYNEGRWIVIGDYFTYELEHSKARLINIIETHKLEYEHSLGKEIDVMKINIDIAGELSGSSDMKVFDNSGKLLCTGKSLFIGRKI